MLTEAPIIKVKTRKLDSDVLDLSYCFVELSRVSLKGRGKTCVYCGIEFAKRNIQTVDHRVPRWAMNRFPILGEMFRFQGINRVLSCADCNTKKGIIPFGIFMKIKDDSKALELSRQFWCKLSSGLNHCWHLYRLELSPEWEKAIIEAYMEDVVT